MRYKYIMICCIIGLLSLQACSPQRSQQMEPEPSEEVIQESQPEEMEFGLETATPTPTEPEKVDINILDFNVTENRENELVFTISIDDFISSYNGFYWSGHESRYLSPSSEWVCFTYDSTAHSNYETYYYRFSEDEKIWSLPTVSVYVPTDNGYIQEITLDFDDHGYTEPMYILFEEICFYTLKVLFPDFEDDKITELYKALYDKTNDPRCYVSTGEPSPKVLYYANDIGLYSFYRGGAAHICVIPITNQYLDKLTSQNVEIHSIDNEF